MSTPYAGNGIRMRPAASRAGPGRVHYGPQPVVLRIPQTFRQRLRIQQFQRRWKNIKQDLPPQLSRRHSEDPEADEKLQSEMILIFVACSWYDLDRRRYRNWFVPGIWGTSLKLWCIG